MSAKMSLRYVPHTIYSLTLTSISMHLLYNRREAEEDRSRLSAKISILASLVDRLSQGERINPGELDRLRKLAGLLDMPASAPADAHPKIRWRDVLLGRKEQHGIATSGWDQKDWEKVEQEIKSSC